MPVHNLVSFFLFSLQEIQASERDPNLPGSCAQERRSVAAYAVWREVLSERLMERKKTWNEKEENSNRKEIVRFPCRNKSTKLVIKVYRLVTQFRSQRKKVRQLSALWHSLLWCWLLKYFRPNFLLLLESLKRSSGSIFRLNSPLHPNKNESETKRNVLCMVMHFFHLKLQPGSFYHSVTKQKTRNISFWCPALGGHSVFLFTAWAAVSERKRICYPLTSYHWTVSKSWTTRYLVGKLAHRL